MRRTPPPPPHRPQRQHQKSEAESRSCRASPSSSAQTRPNGGAHGQGFHSRSMTTGERGVMRPMLGIDSTGCTSLPGPSRGRRHNTAARVTSCHIAAPRTDPPRHQALPRWLPGWTGTCRDDPHGPSRPSSRRLSCCCRSYQARRGPHTAPGLAPDPPLPGHRTAKGWGGGGAAHAHHPLLNVQRHTVLDLRDLQNDRRVEVEHNDVDTDDENLQRVPASAEAQLLRPLHLVRRCKRMGVRQYNSGQKDAPCGSRIDPFGIRREMLRGEDSKW